MARYKTLAWQGFFFKFVFQTKINLMMNTFKTFIFSSVIFIFCMFIFTKTQANETIKKEHFIENFDKNHSNNLIAQKKQTKEKKATKVKTDKKQNLKNDQKDSKKSFHKVLKQKFIEGNPGFMGIVLMCLILGLALCIERIIYLNLSDTNTDKLLEDLESAIKKSGVKGAKEVCRNTAGPVASIFLQGLERGKEGVDVVEKSIINFGSVAMSKLESGLSWISLFIALAPMLGFMGTVIGMIEAFDAIEVAGDISPSLVAGGIKVALLTTVFGLITAIILQIFYNYISAKIESIVNNMEDASISLVDILVKHKITKK